MSEQINVNCENSIELARKFLRTYLEERDFSYLLSLVDEDGTWHDPKSQGIYDNFHAIIEFMRDEQTKGGPTYKILAEQYEAIPLGPSSVQVIAGLKIAENDIFSLLSEINLRVSLLCQQKREKWLVVHGHASVFDYLSGALEQPRAFKNHELTLLTNQMVAILELSMVNGELAMVYANDGFLKLTGYVQEDILQNKANIIHPDDLPMMEAMFGENRAFDRDFSLEYRMIKKDGSLIWVMNQGILRFAQENSVYLQCVLMDITEQKGTMLALKLSEKRYEIAMRFSEVTMSEYDVVSKKIVFAECDVERYGLPLVAENGIETLIDRGIIEPDYISNFREMYQKIDEGAPMTSCFFNARDIKGNVHDFEFHLTNVFDDHGRPIKAIGAKKNITQLRHLQREKQYGATLASHQQFIYEVNITHDKIIMMNETWADEMGVKGLSKFSEVKNRVGEVAIAPEFHQMLTGKLSPENIALAYEAGESLIYTDYRKKIGNGEYHWFRKNVTIIRDDFSHDLIIRCYIVDINDEKKKISKQEEDQKLYEALMAKASFIYEVNLTQNLFLSGHEKWPQLFGIAQTDDYTEMMEAIMQRALHPDDREVYNKHFLRYHVLAAYHNGKNLVVCDYRRPNEQGDFIWVRCTLHLYEDPKTADIKGHAYIEDIDQEKRRELNLIYQSEHDGLTGLYNKVATERYIQAFLSDSEGKSRKQAFFIVDIDHFKAINDNFGHAFGDLVLSQVASKLSDLFRDMDIIGRVGGDEFVILMKHVSSRKVVLGKAQEICNKLRERFVKNGQSYQVSASIGIAFYHEHGKNYEALYRHSDAALYTSKENGRNRFTIYADHMAIEASQVKALQGVNFLALKKDDEEITQYIFRLLHEAQDKKSVIDYLLSVIGKHFKISRVYVFEQSFNESLLKIGFQWCDEGIAIKAVALEQGDVERYEHFFDEEGMFFLPDMAKESHQLENMVNSDDVKSLLQFVMRQNGQIKGIVGFDQCEKNRGFDKKERFLLKKIADILMVFILEMRFSEDEHIVKQLNLSILNELDAYAYVCDPKRYKLVFCNDKMQEMLSYGGMDRFCYQIIWQREVPCVECPMQLMVVDKEKTHSLTLWHQKLGIWMKMTASWIDWVNEEKMCLIHGVDISKYLK